jgi:DNA-directed RNA polymerase specialized sigma subunit
MKPDAPYARNGELFAAFRSLQLEFTARLAAHPGLVRSWLDSHPPRPVRDRRAGGGLPMSWRTARLDATRRARMTDLVARIETSPCDAALLAQVLVESMPVGTYFEIADCARPSLEALDAEAADLSRRLMALREEIFVANFGLARSAALQRSDLDRDESLSAASSGLLDAIDRFAPAKAVRFGFFATYWIRYHIARSAQKHGSVVSFPIHQHRIGRRIERYLSRRTAAGLPPPSPDAVRLELGIGWDAYRRNRFKPRMVPFEIEGQGNDSGPVPGERCLRDPGPGPDATLEEAEAASHLEAILRETAPPSTRVMLAYMRRLGSLPEAAADYLAGLHRQIAESLGLPEPAAITRPRAGGTPCVPPSRGPRAS